MRSESRGYSVLELLVVLSLTVTLISIGLPNLIKLRDAYQLKTTADTIAIEMQYARFLAIARNSHIKIVFHTRPKSYHLVDHNGGPVGALKYVSAGIHFLRLPRADICFHGKGNAVPAGGVTIKNKAGAIRIIANPGGRIRQEYVRE